MVHLNLRLFTSATPKFRNSFQIPNVNALRWFPGHMDRGMKQMQKQLTNVDCVIEIHDARIPVSGRNPNFRFTISGIKPHILVLNKMDLTDLSRQKEIENAVIKEGGINEIIFANSKKSKCKTIEKVIPLAEKLIRSSNRYNRNEVKEFNLMIIGVPNVGKSSFLNHIRNVCLKKGGGAATGSKAGITRAVTTRIKVSEDPLVYVYDTPGILTPTVPDIETGMKLALCETTQDHLVGFKNMADYLLYWMNKNKHFRYVQTFDLEEPCDNIGLVLVKIAVTFRLFSKIKTTEGNYARKPDLDRAAFYFIDTFRKGHLGKILLDEDVLFPGKKEQAIPCQ